MCHTKFHIDALLHVNTTLFRRRTRTRSTSSKGYCQIVCRTSLKL